MGLHLAELKGGEVNALQVEYIDGAELKAGLLDILDGVYFQVEAEQADSLLHDGGVAGDDRATLVVGLLTVQGAHGDFRSDAGGVAHGDG